MSVQGNLDMSGRVPVPNGESRDSGDESDDGNGSEDSTVDMEQSDVEDALGLRLSTYIEGPTRLVKVKRPSNCEPWGLSLSVVFRREKKFLAVVVPGGESNDRSFEDIVVAIDGQRVGEGPTSTLREIASSFLRDRTDLTLEVGRVPQ